MGWCSHIYEAEYEFDRTITIAQAHAAFIGAVASSNNYVLGGQDPMFKRYPVEQATQFHNAQVLQQPSFTVFAVCISKLWKFVDDIAFSFGTGPIGQVVVRGWSHSRIGEGDMFKNKKNIEHIIHEVAKTIGRPTQKDVYQS
mmetsp:Transcript_23235/g.41915  ORF Transcript_23235/g.41915 Transcript_23235/m.41915 type:complete len:142 (-) Transcript_23235:469-894(-)